MQSTMWDLGHKNIISSDLPNQCMCYVCECGPSRDAKRSSFPGARCALCCYQARWVTCIVIFKSQNIPMWLIWGNWGSEELGSSSKVIRDMAGSELKPRSTLSPLWDPIVLFLMWWDWIQILLPWSSSRWALGEERLMLELQGSWNRGLCVVRSFPSLKISFPFAASVFG